jgi:succinate dehydrogenase/fumarate reductase flavoprotein subunit
MSAEEFETDVLIIGGGMAATWAGITAARAGARVTLVDKGFVGASGVTATGGPNHWWVPPDEEQRRAAIDKRWATSHGLAEKAWMARIIDMTWRLLPQLAPYYAFDKNGAGETYYSGVRGPEYMRALRRFSEAEGVRILDHHPALELLRRSDGSIAGAAGYARLDRRDWIARAGAVILATGGAGFRSGLLGSHNNTGDGHLMAVEAGAELSGMEFCVAYSISPAWNSTRTLPYLAARFFDAAGTELDIAPPMSGPAHLQTLAAALARGPVFAELHDAPALLKDVLRQIQPASLPPFERKGLDLFKDRFPVTLYGEGTIRGTGGLRVVDDACQTSVPGLFAAGDAATRELIAGATSGGGALNAAWALTSGVLAGEGAAATAKARARRADGPVSALGQAGLRPHGAARPIDARGIIALAGEQILSPTKALWRNRPALEDSAAKLEQAWDEVSRHGHAEGLDKVGVREAAAVAATARWSNAAALAREESRGMHMRSDIPGPAADLARRLLVGGLESTWTRYEAVAAAEAA